jgi:ABC-2 type transport system ATP-binding protein
MEQQAAAPLGTAQAAEKVIGAEGLVKRFGEREALKGVSLSAARGELVAVIGPNGAGKTTLLSILARIQKPDAGSVDWPSGEVGWVPQQPALYGKLTVAENLSLFARLERVPDVEASVERMLELTGLRRRAGDEVGRLSGGNRQRVNIAIGLVAEPELLLLDEPSSHLDPEAAALVEPLLATAPDRARVLVTHEIDSGLAEADRVLALRAGGAVAYEGPANGLSAGDARAIYGGAP